MWNLPSAGLLWLLPLALLAAASEEPGTSGQCSADGQCDGGSQKVRAIADKTPTPCRKDYSSEFVEAAAQRHLAEVQGKHETPHLLMLLGGSGAGKGTFVRHVAENGLSLGDFVFHGLDEYLVHLPEFRQTMEDPDTVFKDAADDCYTGAIAIAKATEKKLIQQKVSAIYEETGKNLDRILKRVLPPFEAAGYRVSIVLVDNEPAVAKARAHGRFLKEGRYAPDDYIDGTFRNVPENYKALRESGRVHEAVYCDNSCDQGKQQDSGPGFCLECWRDVVSHQAGGDAKDLLPAKALLEGPPRYLHEAAR